MLSPRASGQIGRAGNDIANGQGAYLGKSPANHTWFPSAPYLTANNVVSLIFNVTKPPLNHPAVRQAVSFGIHRQQLSAHAATGYDIPPPPPTRPPPPPPTSSPTPPRPTPPPP